MARGLLRTIGGLFRPIWVFLRLPVQILASALLLAALFSAAWSWYWSQPGGAASTVPSSISDAVDSVCQQVPEELPRPERVLRPMLLLPLVGDRQMLVTQSLRQAISEQGWYRVVEQGTLDQALDKLFQMIGAPRGPVTDPATAIKLAKAASAEVVLMGRVEELAPTDLGTVVAIRVRLFDAATGEKLLDKTFDNKSPLSAVSTVPSIWLAAWLALGAFALIWPPLLMPVMRRVLKMESNFATAMTILLVTAVPATIAWPLFFGSGAGLWQVLTFIVGTMLMCLWCMAVMSWVAEDEG